MRHIVTESLVIQLVDIVCLTESQKLAHLIYLEQLTWIPINAGEAPEDSMTPMIGVSWDVELGPDRAVHIMHITVGTSAVHLVGKKSVIEFDMFTMSLYEEDMGLLNHAGYIHILGDGVELPKKYMPSPRQIGRASEKGTLDQGGGGISSLEDICSV